MENFEYYNPTRIVFGKGTVARLNNLVGPDERVLLLSGGGSIMRNGVHAQVTDALGKRLAGEFSGIEANPEYETCMKAVEAARNHEATLLLSVGGGSVLDATKFIAAAIPFEGEPWDILEKAAPVKTATPLASVLTLPATGSEANMFSVVSRRATREKLAFGSPAVFPRFSILDPETTFSLPRRQTVNGIIDPFVHVFEQYMTYPVNSPLQDRQAEAILATLIEEGPKALKTPDDYDARANIMWCSTQALNGIISCGVPLDWSTHRIGHELTANFGIDHAQTLAVVLPSLLRHQLEKKQVKLAQYGRRIWHLNPEKEEDELAVEAIERTEEFFQKLGVPTTLNGYGVDIEKCTPIWERFAHCGQKLGEHADIGPEEVEAILTAAHE